MIENPEKMREFGKRLTRENKVTLSKDFRLLDAINKEAVDLGVFPLKDPLEGIEIDTKIAKVVNFILKNC